MRPQPFALETPQVALTFDGAGTLLNLDDVARALACRGLTATQVSLEHSIAVEAQTIAFAPAEPISVKTAFAIGAIARASALANRPMVVLTAHAPPSDKQVGLRAAALAYLHSCGAILCADPDTWLETIALFAGYGIPNGTNLAIIAPPGTWLATAAVALMQECSAQGVRFPAVVRDAANPANTTDIVLVDPSVEPPTLFGHTIAIPVVARAELLSSPQPMPLVGLRAALAAAVHAGGFGAQRKALTTRSPSNVSPLPDRERFDRQVAKLGKRAGDHETKVLLAAYGIAITRQAVATTPSAASRIAKQAGYPVEMKPWDPEAPSERDGCPIETGLTSAAQVRRAFTTLTKSSDSGAVIVRETPPAGHDIHATLARIEPLGWVLILTFPNRRAPLAAPLPLSTDDANRLASQLEASRARDLAPNRAAFAEILIRISLLIEDHPNTFQSLSLSRIVVAEQEALSVVADAHAVLAKR